MTRQDNAHILPGLGVGELRLGMTPEEVGRRVPLAPDREERVGLFLQRSGDLTFWFDAERRRLTQIMVSSRAAGRLLRTIRVGTPLRAVEDLGVVLTIDGDGNVAGLNLPGVCFSVEGVEDAREHDLDDLRDLAITDICVFRSLPGE